MDLPIAYLKLTLRAATSRELAPSFSREDQAESHAYFASLSITRFDCGSLAYAPDSDIAPNNRCD
ncbi:hypothetical protein CS8_101110 [Cupriavidus sp. 8B]